MNSKSYPGPGFQVLAKTWTARSWDLGMASTLQLKAPPPSMKALPALTVSKHAATGHAGHCEAAAPPVSKMREIWSFWGGESSGQGVVGKACSSMIEQVMGLQP